MTFGTAGRPAPGKNPAAPAAATWHRDDWLVLADRMLAAARPFASPGHARITLARRRRAATGGPSTAWRASPAPSCSPASASRASAASGRRRARRLVRDRHRRRHRPRRSPDRWVRLDEHPQAKVEAASIALILDLTRPWIWDRLAVRGAGAGGRLSAPRRSATTRTRGSTGSGSGWSCRRSCARSAGPHSLDEMAEDLRHPRRIRPRRTAGCPTGHDRAYDHYVGWALHLYPTLWARMAGAADLAAQRRERDLAGLDRFLGDAVALVGADGSPLIQGRSLIYRFAAAAPFWVGAIAGVPSVSPGQLRRAATRIVRHFAANGAPDERGLLTLGWHGPWPRLAQSYSGPGSPYWASKGLLGIALPADHPVWTTPEEPLPVEERDTLRAIPRAGLAGLRHPGRRHRPRRQPRHRPRRRGCHRRRFPALRPAGLLHRHQPRPRRQRLGQSARPVRHPRRRRGSGHPPRRHAPADRARRRRRRGAWPDRRALAHWVDPDPRSARSRRRPPGPVRDRPGTSRCTRWSAAPGNCG